MHSLHATMPEDRPDAVPALDSGRAAAQSVAAQSVLARVIEIGDVTAGIAVPEGSGVRFFSSSRDFDGLDGAVFRSAEQAARAARERFRARARPDARRGLRAIAV